jgi:hypothetical protein
VGQTASVTVSPGPSGQATVTVTNGSLVYDGSTSVPAGTTYGPGSTLTLATTPFGLELSAAGQHLFSFCTAAERVSGQDQQYCGA